ncbi:molybdate transport system permease protein [Planktotalea frisia]|jgi:molybdate transport system permease protein|uniref:Molybdenum transport system permease n=1 Tax=Planktotalea frisia TaxID=696762 RepID=A0A1L9NTS0_9RHOB|nr:molybdate ABC transporter permease subunit [Planktotalea frisia]OJI92621.1 molybdenum transport system permease protein ModB [Planktotalea frisia]PZX33704.1 molybdate transport system permease protein [Planktotalea frisia]
MILSAAEWAIVTLSLRIALVATLLSLPFAIWIAWLLARRDFFGKSTLNIIVHLPLVLPPVVTGYALLLLFGKQGPFGEVFETLFGITFAFRWTGAALAAAIMGFPLIVRAIRLGFEGVDHGLEEAGATLGASKRAVFRRVTLPLITPALLTGAVLGFAKAMGEFGATITFVASIPGQSETLPSAIYTLLQVPGGEADALRLIAISVAVSVLALAISEVLARRALQRVSGQ